MKIIKKYISYNLISTTFLVTLIFSGLYFAIILIGELKDIDKTYTIIDAFFYTFSILPSSIYKLFPSIILLASILFLTKLQNQNEYLIMRINGLSTREIIFLVIGVAFFIIFLLILIHETIGIKGLKIAEIIKGEKQSYKLKGYLKDEVWLKDQNNYIYIENLSNAQLIKVVQYNFDENLNLIESSFAKESFYKDGEWWLAHTRKTIFRDNQTILQQRDREILETKIDDKLLSLIQKKPHLMSFMQLIDIHNDQSIFFNKIKFSYELVKRVTYPFSSLTSLFLTLSFILRFMNKRRIELMLITAVLFALLFFIIDTLLTPIVVITKISPIIIYFIPSFLYIITAIILSRRL